MAAYDLVIGKGDVVLPSGMVSCDIAVKDGIIVGIEKGIGKDRARNYVNAKDKAVLPGAVDAHTHIGIYRPVADDARSESASALHGGVTTMLSYFRTGSHYMNTSGPYAEVLPRLLAESKENFVTDYGYHLAPILHRHVDEMSMLLEQYGVSTFKFYTFYKILNLAASGGSQSYVRNDDPYDAGHLYRIMQNVASLARKHGRSVRLSMHCEDPEIIRTMLDEVKRGSLEGLEAYSAARPPFAEAAAITQVALLAAQTGCPVNLLHLSSKQAVETAARLRKETKGLDATLEVTLHHLSLDSSHGDGVLGKVNPPIRSQADVEALWGSIQDGTVDLVVSDHACTTRSMKGKDVWSADPGFGGTVLLMPLMVSEGHLKRSLPLTRIADLIATKPAKIHGVYPRKGVIAPGSDADLAVVDLGLERVITPAELFSAQDFTPFEGMRVKGWPTQVILRGTVALQEGEVTVPHGFGQYIKRPVASAQG